MTKENLTANPPAPATHPRTGATFFGRDEEMLTKCLVWLEDLRKHVEFAVAQTRKVLPGVTQIGLNQLMNAATTSGGNPMEVLKAEFAKSVPAPAHVDPAKWAEILIYPEGLEELATLWRESYKLKRAAASVGRMAIGEVLYIDKSGKVHLTEAAHVETLVSPIHTTWIGSNVVDAYTAAQAYVEAARHFEAVTGLRLVNTPPGRRPNFLEGGGKPGDPVEVNPKTLEIIIRSGYIA